MRSQAGFQIPRTVFHLRFRNLYQIILSNFDLLLRSYTYYIFE